MFYSQLLLAKKGPLGKVWLAAHWEKKLNKQTILQTDIKATVEQVKKPVTPLSLRVSGHLLLGLSRIYAKKVAYLAADASEVITKLKAFRGGAVASEAELLEDGGAGGGGGGANIDMPDHLLGGDLNILSLDVLGAGAGAGGLDLGAPFALGGDLGDDEWGAIGGSQQAGMPGSQRSGAALYGADDYGVLPVEMAEEEETFDVPAYGVAGSTGNRSGRTGTSSYGDIEQARRADSLSAGGGSSVDRLRRAGAGGDEDDDARSIVSDMDSDVSGRGKKPVAGKRSSVLPGGLESDVTAGALRRAGAGAGAAGLDDLGLDLGGDDYGLGDVMGLNGAAGSGAADVDDVANRRDIYAGDEGAYAGYGDYDGGMVADRDVEMGEGGVGAAVPGTPSGFRGGAADDSQASSDLGLMTAGELAAARAAAAAADAEAAAAARKEREAARKAKAEAKKAAAQKGVKGASSSSSRLQDSVTILSSDVIKDWLRDTAPITDAAAAAPPSQLALAAHLTSQANKRYAELFADAAPDAAATSGGKGGKKSGGGAVTSVSGLFPGLGPLTSSLALLDMVDEADAALLASGRRGGARRRALASKPSTGGGQLSGPDNEALLTLPPPQVDLDVETELMGLTSLISPLGPAGAGALAGMAPSALRLMLAQGAGRVRFPQVPSTEEEEGAGKQRSAEEEEAALEAAAADVDDVAGRRDIYAGDEGAYAGYGDYDGGMVADRDFDLGAAVDAELAAEGMTSGGAGAGGAELDRYIDGGVITPGGGSAADGTPASGAGSGITLSKSRLELASAGEGAGAGEDTAIVAGSGSTATPGSEGGASAARTPAAAATASSTTLVGKEKWHATTVQMLLVLAGEMTGPALPVAGKKRKGKAAEAEEGGAAGVQQQYDLRSLDVGKGSTAEPLSFLDLAAGSVRRTTALSFYQLLQLQTWDIIRCSQPSGPYGDVMITRTSHFAEALAEVTEKRVATASA